MSHHNTWTCLLRLQQQQACLVCKSTCKYGNMGWVSKTAITRMANMCQQSISMQHQRNKHRDSELSLWRFELGQYFKLAQEFQFAFLDPSQVGRLLLAVVMSRFVFKLKPDSPMKSTISTQIEILATMEFSTPGHCTVLSSGRQAFIELELGSQPTRWASCCSVIS